LFYYLLSQNKPIKDSASEAAHGTKKLDMKVLEQWPLPLPPLPIQEKIVSILSAYDDQIETNKRRIVLLQKMAEEIYREWFVRMRFPGYREVKFKKGIPTNWNIVELSNIADEVSRGTKPGVHLSDRFYLPIDLLGPKNFLPLGHLNYTDAKSSLVTFDEGDILFGAMRPYLHKVSIAPFDGVTRTTCFVIRPKNQKLFSYLFLTLFQNSSVDYATLICNGADRPYVVWNRAMERMNILKPDQGTLKLFEEYIRPLLDTIKGKYFVLDNLKKTRNSMLPRLISGRISVDSLDIQFSPINQTVEGEVHA
jgi:type I restriction enzyme S subunit